MHTQYPVTSQAYLASDHQCVCCGLAVNGEYYDLGTGLCKICLRKLGTKEGVSKWLVEAEAWTPGVRV